MIHKFPVICLRGNKLWMLHVIVIMKQSNFRNNMFTWEFFGKLLVDHYLWFYYLWHDIFSNTYSCENDKLCKSEICCEGSLVRQTFCRIIVVQVWIEMPLCFCSHLPAWFANSPLICLRGKKLWMLYVLCQNSIRTLSNNVFFWEKVTESVGSRHFIIYHICSFENGKMYENCTYVCDR